MRTETSSAVFLLAAVAAALVWANVGPHSYEAVWQARFTVGFDTRRLSLTVHEWINSGLMSLFFFVVGLEARRDFDMGELRDRRWLLLSAIAGLGSMIVPALIFVLVNAGRESVHGWGTAMSTDTAFALGVLAVFGSRLPASLRAFLLSVSVVDDLVALLVIAVFYSDEIRLPALLVAVCALLAIALLRLAGVRGALYCAVLSVVVWVALHEAGVDPVVAGLAVGVLVAAYPRPRRSGAGEPAVPALSRAADARAAPQRRPGAGCGDLAERAAGAAVPAVGEFRHRPAVRPGQRRYRTLRPGPRRRLHLPVTLGIVLGCVVGKVIGTVGSMAAARLLSGGRLRPNVGWGSVTVGGAIAGSAFTVSLLIASLAFDGAELEEARIGILVTLVGAFLTSWAVTAVIGLLPERRRARALLGDVDPLTDLAVPVDRRHDRIRGPESAVVTVVEYGDFECPYCGQAEPVVRDLLGQESDVRYVWRHLPLRDVHPRAQLAAEASEAAARQDRFWEMHDLLLERQNALAAPDLLRYAGELGLDVERFRQDLRDHLGARRVAEDVDSADLSRVSGTPTFFINGRRHHGAYDIAALTRAVELARQRALTG